MRIDRLACGASSRTVGFLLLATPAIAQQTSRVTVDSAGVEGNLHSWSTSVSADGRIVAFASSASNLVAGDTNSVHDVFVHDRSTGITERVSVDSSGAEGSGLSDMPAISADGQIVAFVSRASNLVANDTNGLLDVFVHDRSTGVTERVNLRPSGAQTRRDCRSPAISADGLTVAYHTTDPRLVPGDTNSKSDVFVHDRTSGITERVSVDSAGGESNDTSEFAALSADGQIVAFESIASNLDPNDGNSIKDIFVHDRSTGITERVSKSSSGAGGSGNSSTSWISADGAVVTFHSYASNLVSADTNTLEDVFVHDRSTATTERVSVDSTGAEAKGYSMEATISADGQLVAFRSYAANLVPGDTNGYDDLFVHDRSTGITARVNVSSSGKEANGLCGRPMISADGNVVAFASEAPNLVSFDTNAESDVFVRLRYDATWSNYGAGFPGTNGIPAFTSQVDPVLGSTVTVDLANSYGASTVGVLFFGYLRTVIHSSWGGDLLVVPSITTLLAVPSSGMSLSDLLPPDPLLGGLAIDLQAIESDPGAAKGISFTPGLELVLGY